MLSKGTKRGSDVEERKQKREERYFSILCSKVTTTWLWIHRLPKLITSETPIMLVIICATYEKDPCRKAVVTEWMKECQQHFAKLWPNNLRNGSRSKVITRNIFMILRVILANYEKKKPPFRSAGTAEQHCVYRIYYSFITQSWLDVQTVLGEGQK